MSAPAGRILVVDDSRTVAARVRDLLEEEGHEVEVVIDPKRFLETVEEFKPDVILLDLIMPDLDGYDCLRLLQKQPDLDGIPVVVFSVQEDRDAVLRALHLGAQDYLPKDAPVETLLERVATWLERGRGPVERDLQLLSGLTRLLTRANEVSGIDAIARMVVDEVGRITRVERASLVLFDQQRQARVIASSDEDGFEAVDIDLGDYPELRTVMESHRPLLVDVQASVKLVETLFRDPHELPFRTLLLFPMRFRQQLIGVLFLRSDQPAASFGRDTIHFCQAAAQAIAAPIHYLGSLQDVDRARERAENERAQAESALAETREFELFFNQVSDGLVIVDEAGQVVRANRRLRHLLGYAEDDLRGRPLLDFVAPEDRTRIEAIASRMSAGDFEERRFQVLLTDSGGATRPFEASVEPLPGMPDRAIVDLRDVGELRELNRELHRAKIYLENVIQSSPDAIMAADLDGRITLFNTSAQSLTGWPPSEIRERDVSIERFYPRGEARRVMRMMRQDRERGGAGQVHNLRATLVSRQGAEIPILLNAALLTGDDGQPTGSVGIFTDLRELHAIEQELEDARQQLIQSEREAAVAALAGATAHKLNQPLTAVLGYVQMLRRRHPELAEDPSVGRIETSAERMAEIVREIGRITRFEVQSYAESNRILSFEAQEPSGDESDGDGGTDEEPETGATE